MPQYEILSAFRRFQSRHLSSGGGSTTERLNETVGSPARADIESETTSSLIVRFPFLVAIGLVIVPRSGPASDPVEAGRPAAAASRRDRRRDRAPDRRRPPGPGPSRPPPPHCLLHGGLFDVYLQPPGSFIRSLNQPVQRTILDVICCCHGWVRQQRSHKACGDLRACGDPLAPQACDLS